MNRVILIPYRAGHSTRERNLRAVVDWYRPLGYMVTLANSDPERPFNRAEARNEAAGSVDWDTSLFLDADCLAELEIVQQAFTRAEETDHLILPHDDFWRFNERGTQRLVSDLEFYRTHHRQARYLSDRMTVIERNVMPSGALVVTRAAFSAIGGYDPALSGWGFEDATFLKDAEATVGVERLPGKLWHLYHPTSRGSVEDYERGRALAEAHRAAYTG